MENCFVTIKPVWRIRCSVFILTKNELNDADQNGAIRLDSVPSAFGLENHHTGLWKHDGWLVHFSVKENGSGFVTANHI